jgi:hypothetical protein
MSIKSEHKVNEHTDVESKISPLGAKFNPRGEVYSWGPGVKWRMALWYVGRYLPRSPSETEIGLRRVWQQWRRSSWPAPASWRSWPIIENWFCVRTVCVRNLWTNIFRARCRTTKDRCYDFWNIFAENFGIFDSKLSKILQKFDHNIGFWEKRQFFAENWQKSQKIVIIASTPNESKWK